MGLLDRIKRVWNVFRHEETTVYKYRDLGQSYSYRPDRVIPSTTTEKSIITSFFNRLAVDVSMLNFRHVLVDKEHDDRYLDTVHDSLNRILTLQANKDQTARAFIKDAVISLIDEGCIALVPVDTDDNPTVGEKYDILTVRVGEILEWYPDNVKVRVYNDRTGKHEDLVLPKKMVAIIENPFYQIMNAPNSIGRRLVKKLNLLDIIDEQSGSGKLDLIIQLPYVLKTPDRRAQAEKRRAEIEEQLNGSKYGIAYTDGTEHVMQLNRPVENNVMKQVEYLTSMLFGQYGVDESILHGTADEKTMLNYMNGMVAPIATALTDGTTVKFLSADAISKGHRIMYFNNPFKLVPVSTMAEIGSSMTASCIVSPNEIRQAMGMKPSTDPKADELRNPNINPDKGEKFATTQGTEVQEAPVVKQQEEKSEEGGKNQNG